MKFINTSNVPGKNSENVHEFDNIGIYDSGVEDVF